MNQCDHKTEEEVGICNRCKGFARIARDAKAMLEARAVYLSRLLTPHLGLDEAQAVMTEKVKRLEESVKFADLAQLWEE